MSSAVPSARPRLDPHDPAGIDTLLSEEELAVRQTVRDFCADKILPHVADWYEKGELPGVRELTRELGKIGLLGMHLTGYGCAGMSAVDYGLACLEL
jgi:glutaryl-CoA dehydrogenase